MTITFWHGWSAPSEVKAIQATIDGFEKVHPNIHVKAVGNITDDKINQALRAGGSERARRGVVVHHRQRRRVLQLPRVRRPHAVPGEVRASTRRRPSRPRSSTTPSTTATSARCRCSATPTACTTTRTTFKAAGITRAAEDPLGVRRRRGQADQDLRRHLLPARLHAATTTATSRRSPTSPRSGRRRTSPPTASPTSPTTRRSRRRYEWQKSLVGKLGGYARLEKYRTTFGDEFSGNNPFMTGQVAMAIDGEWRGRHDRRLQQQGRTTASRRSRCPTTRPTSTARATSPARSSGSRAPARSRTPPGSS